MRKKHTPFRRFFKDSWRPEDKALESAEEEALEPEHRDEIARERAERHKHTPPLAGFEKPPSDEPTTRGAFSHRQKPDSSVR
jgi:hypothetical protein